MIPLSPALGQAVETITTWLQLIVTIGAVVSLFYALSKFAAKPNKTQDEKIAILEEWRKHEFTRWQEKVEQRLADGDAHFKNIDKGNHVTQRAILALTDHAINGNNISQLEQARNDLNKYLTGE